MIGHYGQRIEKKQEWLQKKNVGDVSDSFNGNCSRNKVSEAGSAQHFQTAKNCVLFWMATDYDFTRLLHIIVSSVGSHPHFFSPVP